jgi:hypothetical protein
MNATQPELSFAQADKKVTPANVNALMEMLQGAGWLLAKQVLEKMGRPLTEGNRRFIRDLANASKGEIAGGQAGYKLVREMTAGEYQHWRNWMKSQADQMTARVIEADKVFYSRQPVTRGNGIL